MQETVRSYYDNAFACRREVREEETLFFTSYVAEVGKINVGKDSRRERLNGRIVVHIP